jgi:NodT family efflux transporter outer membrane factor (OMF) lipoprotein
MKKLRRLLPLCGAAALTACAVGPNYRTPDMQPPARYDSGQPGSAATAVAPDLAAWWHALDDRELDSLVERAVKANPDILIALDRLQAARTYEAALVGTVLPDVEASGGAGRGTGSDLARGRAAQSLISADNSTGLTHINEVGGFDALWQLDIFGKYRREIEAARADMQADAAARNAVLVTIVADVARAYVELRGEQVRTAVLEAAADSLRESLRIVRIRYERGITNELDVTLATRELATLESQLGPARAQVSAGEYTIATLIGVYPEELVEELTAKSMIPTVPAVVQTGLPVDLLRRRPDVIEAERQLAAANARIGVATANLFPQLAVTAAVGYQRQGLGTSPVLGQHIWSVGPAAVWPLLDFGALDAQVEIANLETRALLANYRKTIQGAVQDVDTAWSAYVGQEDSLGKLGEALVASQRAVTLANERYTRGLTDFLNVVDAERQEYEIEEQYTAAQVAVAEEFIALYRSLGGGWQNYQSLPPIRRPLPAVVAVFKEVLSPDHPLRSP